MLTCATNSNEPRFQKPKTQKQTRNYRSSIVVSLIPNVSALKMHLQSFASIMDADEVVLFERATFLVISHTCEDSVRARDPHRFEKISNIIKQFKLSCSKTAAQFQSMEVKNENFAAYIDYFTTNTYVYNCFHLSAAPAVHHPGGMRRHVGRTISFGAGCARSFCF